MIIDLAKEEHEKYGDEIGLSLLGLPLPCILRDDDSDIVAIPHLSRVPGFIDIYPMTPQGQRDFIHYFIRRARAKCVGGIFYWEPLWIPGEGICWVSEAGQRYIREEGKSTHNEWANQCLFDYEGIRLPAFDEFK